MKVDKIKVDNYIRTGEIAWQMRDGYIKISHDKESSDYTGICSLLSAAPEELTVMSRNDLLNTGFHKLAEWSTEDDVLLSAVDVCICIPKFEYEKITERPIL